MARAGRLAKNATAYVTLEPCSHFGKAPPCSEALISAGVSRCVIGTEDPDPRVNGQGIAQLKAAGIAVEVGLCRREAEDLNAGFLLSKKLGRPFVALKLATTLDGRIACSNGHSQWVTGELARRHVHRLRASFDGVMVGSRTAVADNPRLNVRLPGFSSKDYPWRIVLDSKARLPITHDLVTRARNQPTILVTASAVSAEVVASFEDAGVRVRAIASGDNGHLDLGVVLRELASLGLTRLLVEGGGELAAALLRKDLVDSLLWYSAPTLIGGDGLSALGGLGLTSVTDAVKFELQDETALGEDRFMRFLRRTKPWRSP